MPHFRFRFENTNADQSFKVNDQIDTTKNPIFSGAVNHNDFSDFIQCWKGGDNVGRVTIQGAEGPLVSYDVREDDETLSY